MKTHPDHSEKIPSTVCDNPTLQSDDQQWLDLFFHSPIGIASANIQGYFTDSNPSFQRMLGYTSDEIRRISIAGITHPDDRLILEASLKKLFSGSIPMVQINKRCLRKDGSIVWTRSTLSRVRGHHHELKGAIAIVEDITEVHEAEEALRLSEERMRAIIDNTSVGIVLISSEGNFIDCNPAFASMLGYTKEECLGLNIKAVTSPGHFPETLENFESLSENRIPFFRMESKFLKRDGTELWGQSTVSLVRKEDRTKYIVAIIVDVSRRKEIEKNLEKSQERLKMAVRVSRLGFYEWDIASSRLTISQELREELHCDSNTLTLSQALARIVPEDLPRLNSVIESAASDSTYFHAELRLTDFTMTPLWMEIRGQLALDRKGVPEKIFGTTLNITERKHRDEIWRANEEKLRLATEAAKVGIWDFSFKTGELKCSDRMKEILGIALDKEVDVPILMQCIHPEDRERARDELEKVCKQKSSGSFEIYLHNLLPDGSIRWTMSRGQIIFEGEGPDLHPVRFTGAVLDLSEERRLQEEMKAAKKAADIANQTKSAFLANMSHEIRTPLAAIMGFADLLIEDQENKEDRDKYLGIIQRNAYALMHIVNDILDLSKVEAGHIVIEKLDVSLYQLIEEVIGNYYKRPPRREFISNTPWTRLFQNSFLQIQFV